MLVVTSGCSYSGPYVPPPPSVQNPTLYPGTQQVKTNIVEFWKDISAKEITFTTNSRPAEVWDFYEDVLVKEGWEVRPQSDYELEHGLVGFSGPDGCPIYSYYVKATQVDAGMTEVQLLPNQQMCE